MSLPAEILIDKALIGGEWRDAELRFAVTNPATGEVLAQVPDLTAADARDAVAAAEAAWPAWRRQTAKQRATLLRAWFDAIMAHQEALARLMTLEQGKPLAESRGEVAYGASFVEFYAEEAKRMAGETLPSHGADKRILVFREPIGVVAAITPWNFPLAMITRKCAPALAAGCPVVIKPAEATPLTALALAKLAQDVGFPAGVLNVVTASRPAEIGEVLTTDPRVRKISFTGSTPVGKRLLAQCASTVKKASMELGGNAPSSSSTMPTWMPRWRAPWRQSTATPARPACAPTACWFSPACMTPSSTSWPPGSPSCRLATAWRKAWCRAP